MSILHEQVNKNGIGAVLQILADKDISGSVPASELAGLPSALHRFNHGNYRQFIRESIATHLPPMSQLSLTLINNDLDVLELLAEEGVKQLTVIYSDTVAYGNIENIKSNVPASIQVNFRSIASPHIQTFGITFVVVGLSRSLNYSLLTESQAKMINMLKGSDPSVEIVMIDPITHLTGFVQDCPDGWEPISNERFMKILTPVGTIDTRFRQHLENQ